MVTAAPGHWRHGAEPEPAGTSSYSVTASSVGSPLPATESPPLAFLTAIAASVIVIGEVAGEEQEIEKQEGQILDILREIDAWLERLEHLRATTPAAPDTQRTGGAHDVDQTVG